MTVTGSAGPAAWMVVVEGTFVSQGLKRAEGEPPGYGGRRQ